MIIVWTFCQNLAGEQEIAEKWVTTKEWKQWGERRAQAVMPQAFLPPYYEHELCTDVSAVRPFIKANQRLCVRAVDQEIR